MTFVFHIVMMILGINLSIGFMGLDLLAIINLTETFRYVLKSITIHFDQLIATYILGIIIMYVYSVFIHTYFFDSFDNLEPRVRTSPLLPEETACLNLVRCFWAVINDAFKNGNGVRPLMKGESFLNENYNFYYARLFIELSFFLIINITLLNIIFGITIETFANMRD